MSNRIKEIRKNRELTLLQLAEMLGVSESTVQRYESGNIKNLKYETMINLAEILDCTPAYLMGWDEYDEPYYENEETAKLAQEMFDDPDLHALLDAAKDCRPEYIKSATQLLKSLKETNPDG